MDAERVYAEWMEARSFGCKKCGYTSTNRRVVEQHLRQMHRDLFAVAPSPGPSPASRERGAAPSGDDGAAGDRLTAVDGTATGRAISTPNPGSPLPQSGGGAGGGGHPIFYTDAGTWDNGTARQRSVLAVWDDRTRSIVVHEDLPGTTNNEAEYAAIIAALELARDERLTGVVLRSDSQLCVKQIKGEYKIKEERLRPLRDRAARLLGELRGQIEWVPRERNYAGIFLEKKYKK
jgi:ribonuclease HI